MKRQIKAYTDRNRSLSKIIISIYRFLLLIKYIVNNPLDYLRYRTHFEIIAAPGTLGFQGGIFNPGVTLTEDGDTILLAKGQVKHWVLVESDNPHEYLKGAPVFMSFDNDNKLKTSCQVHDLHHFPLKDDLELEDFRLFRYQDEIWVNHNIIQVDRTPGKMGYAAATVCLSHLDTVTHSLTFLGYPNLDFDIQNKEKNWLFTEFENDLYLFYSFHPYRVLKLSNRDTLTFSTIINQPLGPELSDIGGFGTYVSYSTNPVPYDEQHFLLLIHQIDPNRMGRLYYHWGVLVDKATMCPVKVTTTPLFSGIGARGALRGVVYVMSVIEQDNEFIFYCGEGDTYLSRTKMSKDKLEPLWMAVPDLRPVPQLV